MAEETNPINDTIHFINSSFSTVRRAAWHESTKVIELDLEPVTTALVMTATSQRFREKMDIANLNLGHDFSMRCYYSPSFLKVLIKLGLRAPLEVSSAEWVFNEDGSIDESEDPPIPVDLYPGRVMDYRLIQVGRGRQSKSVNASEREFIERFKKTVNMIYEPRYASWDPETGVLTVALRPRIAHHATQIDDPAAWIFQVYKNCRTNNGTKIPPRSVVRSKRSRSENRLFRIVVGDDDLKDFFSKNPWYLLWKTNAPRKELVPLGKAHRQAEDYGE